MAANSIASPVSRPFADEALVWLEGIEEQLGKLCKTAST
jgi:hypothetical protein